MSGVSILIRLLVASSLTLVPIPLQFQETTFIIYFYCGGLPWSFGSGVSSSSEFLPIASQGLVGSPEACLYTFPILFFPVLSCDLLWIFWQRFENLLFLLPPLSPLILGLPPQLLRVFL